MAVLLVLLLVIQIRKTRIPHFWHTRAAASGIPRALSACIHAQAVAAFACAFLERAGKRPGV